MDFEDFLDFDDEILTEAVLSRITSLVNNSRNINNNNNTNIDNNKECKLLLSVLSINNIINNKNIMLNQKYKCKVEILKDKKKSLLTRRNDGSVRSNNNSDDSPTIYNKDNDSKPHIFDIAEYYGQIEIKFTIKYYNKFYSKVIGSKSIKLHELLYQQSNFNKSSNNSASWGIPYSISIVTNIKKKKSIINKQNYKNTSPGTRITSTINTNRRQGNAENKTTIANKNNVASKFRNSNRPNSSLGVKFGDTMIYSEQNRTSATAIHQESISDTNSDIGVYRNNNNSLIINYIRTNSRGSSSSNESDSNNSAISGITSTTANANVIGASNQSLSNSPTPSVMGSSKTYTSAGVTTHSNIDTVGALPTISAYKRIPVTNTPRRSSNNSNNSESSRRSNSNASSRSNDESHYRTGRLPKAEMRPSPPESVAVASNSSSLQHAVSQPCLVIEEYDSVVVRLNVVFRITALQNCLFRILPSPPSFPFYSSVSLQHNIDSCLAAQQKHPVTQWTEFHFLAVYAPVHIVVEVMKALAQSRCLSRALSVRTTELFLNRDQLIIGKQSGDKECSNAYTPFELALLAGRDRVIVELLQRSGNLCFPGIELGTHCPIHAAVRGGSAKCVLQLCKFLKKHGARMSMNDIRNPFWTAGNNDKIDWRDSTGMTPFATAATFPWLFSNSNSNGTEILSALVEAGANPAAINPFTRYTPLMYACSTDNAYAVEYLLSLHKTVHQISASLLQYNDDPRPGGNRSFRNSNNVDALEVNSIGDNELMTNQQHRSGVVMLANHIRTNARSRTVLTGRDPATGGYFNPLSVYLCDPCHRESKYGRQAIHIAADRCNYTILKMLVTIGLSLAEPDLDGNNVFHLTVQSTNNSNEKIALIKWLLEMETRQYEAYREIVKDGKSLETMQYRPKAAISRNILGKTPADLAFEHKHFEIAELIIESGLQLYNHVTDNSSSSSNRKRNSVEAMLISRYERLLKQIHSKEDADIDSNNGSVDHAATNTHSTDRNAYVSQSVLTKEASNDNNSTISNNHNAHSIDSKVDDTNDSTSLLVTNISDIEAQQFTDNNCNWDEFGYDDDADEVEYMLALSSLSVKTLHDHTTSSAARL